MWSSTFAGVLSTCVLCTITSTTANRLLTPGVTAVELDTQDQYYVGLGGIPNSDGVMEFDAAVMDGTTMSYGAVLAIR